MADSGAFLLLRTAVQSARKRLEGCRKSQTILSPTVAAFHRYGPECDEPDSCSLLPAAVLPQANEKSALCSSVPSRHDCQGYKPPFQNASSLVYGIETKTRDRNKLLKVRHARSQSSVGYNYRFILDSYRAPRKPLATA